MGKKMTELTLFELYQKLAANLEADSWWPADTKYEIILGAILVQNTNWKNVTYSLALLNEHTGFDYDRVLELSAEELQVLIRPSGFYKNKAKSILAITRWLKELDFDYERITEVYGRNLRSELLKLPGIGNETADVLMVYVFEQPAFISDKYAQKLLMKLGMVGVENYQKAAKKVRLTPEFTVSDAKAFHGFIVDFGKQYLNRDGSWKDSFLDEIILKI
jgi:endonuclease-3 related protein